MYRSLYYSNSKSTARKHINIRNATQERLKVQNIPFLFWNYKDKATREKRAISYPKDLDLAWNYFSQCKNTNLINIKRLQFYTELIKKSNEKQRKILSLEFGSILYWTDEKKMKKREKWFLWNRYLPSTNMTKKKKIKAQIGNIGDQWGRECPPCPMVIVCI